LDKVILVDLGIWKEKIFIVFDEIIGFPIFETFNALEYRVLSLDYGFFAIW
jgi:hypothetical protein